ncbi:MAG TPA: hypothetical protein RMH99_04845 [Sandaracinaceae bacterium LLY-WYZ-13_1]|nr:hypothetical protein [Sandaracinaceae bacterium LLY-WYZ-13_1]
MLERAALHQTRFRTPGVTPDARGVVLGQKGAVLFPSLDRLVAFLRAYGEEGSLDELLPTLSLRRVVTPLKTREILLLCGAESSYRMDRIASVAKLAGGLVFTGTSRHFVKYRDASSPLGYDVEDLLDEQADVVLYHDGFRQAYAYERELAFRDLVMKLEPVRVPPSEARAPTRLYVTAEVGIGGALVGYLFRWQVRARAAFAEWPSESAFEDTTRRLYVFDVEEAEPRIVDLMTSLPGVHVFEPLGGAFAVELGYRHPIALESCQSIFDDEALTLFRGDGDVVIVDPAPPFAPVRSLVRNELSLESAGTIRQGQAAGGDLSFELPLRLDSTMAPWRAVVASVVSAAHRPWLARMLYALPPRTLSTLRMAIGDERIYLLDRGGIEGVPLGTFYSEVAERIYVPAGMTLVPAVAPQVLQDLVSDRQGGHVFFEPETSAPYVVPANAFGPVSRQVLREVAGAVVHADAPDRHDPPLPLMEYGDARRFPLWGVPGKDLPVPTPATDDAQDDET